MAKNIVPFEPELEDGQSYETVIRNLRRLLKAGWPLSECREIVLDHAGLSRIPSRRPGEFVGAVLPPLALRKHTVH